MFNNISYNVVIERFKVFAGGHYLIKRFSHGQVDQTDLDKDQQFPWMHVAPVEVRAAAGVRLFTFDVIFADIPRDKEDKTDYQKESISDMIRLAEDLLSEIQNGQLVFSDLVEVEGESTITPFIEEWTHTLSGCTLALTISVPNNYSACDIPADWSIGSGGTGSTPPTPFPPLTLKVNNVDNVLQNILNIVDGNDIEVEDLGDGRVRINSTALASITWGSITGTLSNQLDLQDALDLKADIASLGAVAFSNDYNDLDNLPTIPAAQVPSDWSATTGVTRILNKPTIPAAQVNSDWNAVSGIAEILNKPTIPAAQVNSNWAASSGVAQILNKPTIPANLDDLSDVNVPTPTNGQVLSYDTSTGRWIASTPATTGTVSSVGLTAPAAFNVSGSPVTTSGTIAITGAGTTSQYIRGNGTLATFPTIPPAQVNSDWNATSGVAEILNKPTIPAAQIQSDWNQSNPSALDFIKNKPSIGIGSVTSVALALPSPLNPAFTVSGSPVTTSGTLTIGANGTTLQYIDGTGALQTMPTGLPPTGTAGGDLSGTYPNPNVSRIHGIDMQSGTPSVGDVWLYEGSPTKWQHQQLPAVHVGNDSAVTGSTVKDALNHLNTTKVEANAVITAGTATKVTYDAKGLITSGTTLAASDLPTGIDAAKIGAGTVSNTEFGYLDGVTSALQTQLNAKEPTITAGTTSQYYRGDKTFQTLDKSAVGLSNVDNTSDANKPISTATQTALNAKQDTLVSGTNIKTVNSTSLLGSGNVSVGTVTSVGGTGTVAGLSLSGTVTGSGNLTLGGTLAVPVANITATGTPSATTFLRGDGSWQTPSSAVSTMVFSSQMTVTQGSNSTAYWAITGSNVPNATENLRSVVMPVSGTIKNFYVRIGAAQSATGSLVFTLRKNSVSQAITVTFTNADGSNVTKSDTTNTFTVAAGDLITIQGVNNAPSSASATVISFSIILER